jgi:hypothetical protein
MATSLSGGREECKEMDRKSKGGRKGECRKEAMNRQGNVCGREMKKQCRIYEREKGCRYRQWMRLKCTCKARKFSQDGLHRTPLSMVYPRL